MNTNFNKGYLCDEASQDICFSMLHICIMLEFFYKDDMLLCEQIHNKDKHFLKAQLRFHHSYKGCPDHFCL